MGAFRWALVVSLEPSQLERRFGPLRGNCATTIAVVLSSFFVPTLINAQSSAPDQSCIFEGEVVSAATGDPIASAQVILNGTSGGGRALTDSAGHFCIRSVATGQYFILTREIGFVPNDFGENAPNAKPKVFFVSEGSAFKNLLIRLLPEAEINGHVYDENLHPFRRVTVVAVQERWREGLLHLQGVLEAQTNGQGYYSIKGLAPGNYFLRAIVYSPPSRRKIRHPAKQDTADETSYVPSFYPASTDYRGAGVVNLRAGDERGPFDFHLHTVSTYLIKGDISEASLSKARDTAIEISVVPKNPDSPDFDLHRRRLSFKQGSFVIRGILPGPYVLIARVTAKHETYSGRVTVTVGESDVDSLRLILSPNFDLPGKVSLNGDPAVRVSDIRMVLSTMRPEESSSQYAQVTPDGRFTFNNISEGPAALNISGCRNCYLKSLTVGGDSYAPDRIEITREAASLGLKVTVGTDGAQVTGMVVDSNQKPAAGAYVAIVPEAPPPLNQGFYRTAFTDSRGQFGIAGLPAGDFLVFAWPSPRGAALRIRRSSNNIGKMASLSL